MLGKKDKAELIKILKTYDWRSIQEHTEKLAGKYLLEEVVHEIDLEASKDKKLHNLIKENSKKFLSFSKEEKKKAEYYQKRYEQGEKKYLLNLILNTDYWEKLKCNVQKFIDENIEDPIAVAFYLNTIVTGFKHRHPNINIDQIIYDNHIKGNNELGEKLKTIMKGDIYEGKTEEELVEIWNKAIYHQILSGFSDELKKRNGISDPRDVLLTINENNEYCYSLLAIKILDCIWWFDERTRPLSLKKAKKSKL